MSRLLSTTNDRGVTKVKILRDFEPQVFPIRALDPAGSDGLTKDLGDVEWCQMTGKYFDVEKNGMLVDSVRSPDRMEIRRYEGYGKYKVYYGSPLWYLTEKETVGENGYTPKLSTTIDVTSAPRATLSICLERFVNANLETYFGNPGTTTQFNKQYDLTALMNAGQASRKIFDSNGIIDTTWCTGGRLIAVQTGLVSHATLSVWVSAGSMRAFHRTVNGYAEASAAFAFPPLPATGLDGIPVGGGGLTTMFDTSLGARFGRQWEIDVTNDPFKTYIVRNLIGLQIGYVRPGTAPPNFPTTANGFINLELW